MTPTPNPTAEQILTDEWILQADRAKAMTGMDAIWFPDAGETLAALRAHNLLSEGAPSEEQLREMVANLIPLDLIHDRQRPGQPQDAFEAADRIIAALTAAGVAPQEPSDAWVDRQLAAEVAAKSGEPTPPTAREKLIAELRERARPKSENGHITDALSMTAADALAAQPALDPEKVAEVIAYANTALDDLPSPGSTAEALARALCEAYTEGKLR